MDNGYSEPEGFTNVIIAGNIARNVGNLAIGVGACAGCTIENNVIVHEQLFGLTAVAAPDRAPGAGDLDQDEIVVRNNSIWIGPARGGTAKSVRGMGDDHVLASNAIHYAGTSTSFNCLRADLPDVGAYELGVSGAIFSDDFETGDTSDWATVE